MTIAAIRKSKQPEPRTGRDAATSLSKLHFEALCRTARAMFDVRAASIHVRDERYDWSDLASGEDHEAWAFAASFAECPIAGRPAFWIEDAREDPAFAELPYVVGTPGLRFVASVRFGPNGIGRLSLFDTRAHAAPADGPLRLQDLGAIADQHLRLAATARETMEREAEFRLLAETSTDTIVRGTLDGIRLYVSPSVKTLLGYDPEELVGRKAFELTHPDDLPAFQTLMTKVREGYLDVGLSEQRQRHRDGSWIWLEASLRLIRDQATGTPNGYVVSVRDIGRRKELEARLARLAAHDELTGLPKRLLFGRHLSKAAENTRHTGQHFAVLYMDIDGFKQVNDSLGHQAGDALLREIANRFRCVLATGDVVARLGGDEFAAIARVNRSNAASLSEQLIAAAAKPFVYGTAEVPIGLSIGIACAPENGLQPGALLACADRALYCAKAAGKNTFRFFDELKSGCKSRPDTTC